MGISVLGPLTLDDSAPRLGPRDTVVLAALAAAGDEALSADELAEAVWGDTPPASWHKNLQSCVVRLRKVLGAGAIETTGTGYRLTLPADAVDARQFEALAERGHELLELGEPDRAAYALSQALALWRGRPFTELEEWEPGSLEAARLSELRLDAQEWWLEASVQAGHHRDVLAQAQALANAAPLRERRWELLALAQYRAGRQGEALRTIARVRRRLVDELGIDPGPGLGELEGAILRQDPDLDVASVRQQPSEACPYLGLLPYDVEDDEGFFGRDRDIRLCRERLDAEGVLAVLGPSGSGKSSLVRAGIVAALRREGQHSDVIAPGRHPVGALPPPRPTGKPRLLVVDQAEELFSLCDDLEEQDRFVQLLADHAEAAPLVLVLRADRMGDVSAHPVLARLVERGLYVLAAMTVDELRAAIEGPARQAGLIIEPGLVDLLVREVENEPGALPLLSHALRETWLRREGRTLTVAGYQASGGIRGAVAQSAESLYGELEPDQRRSLHDLLLRLVSPGTEGEPVRARVPRRQVATGPGQDELVDRLVRTRLVTSDDGVVEIAHEALARAWPRLRGWLEDDVEGQRILHHLSATADTWDSLGRPPSELYRGIRLAQALEWRDRPHPQLNTTEGEFLDESAALAEAEERATAEQARRQSRLIRRLRIVLAGACVLLLVALAAGGFAAYQQNQAEDNAEAAVAAETAADARAAGARALVAENVDDSLLQAVAGARLDESATTRANLQGAIDRRPELVRSVPHDGADITGLALNSAGSRVAVFDHLGAVTLYDAVSWDPLAEFITPEIRNARDQVAPMAFSPDGATLAVGMPLLESEPVRLLDAETLEETRGDPLPGLTTGERGSYVGNDAVGLYLDRAIDLAWDRDGTTLAALFHRVWSMDVGDRTAGEAGGSRLLVWDMTGAPRLVLDKGLPGHRHELRDRNQLVLAPDGQTVWTSQPFSAIEVPSGRIRYRIDRAGYDIALSPDGTTIALDDEADVLVLDASTGEPQRRLRGHAEAVNALTFSPDGSQVASTAGDSTGIVWDPATGAVLHRLDLGATSVQGLAYSPEGDTLHTAGADDAIRLWDLTGRASFIERTRPPGEFGSGWVIVSPGSRYSAHSDQRGLRFFDTAAGRPTEYVNETCCDGGAFDPAGSRFVAVSGGDIWVYDPDTGELLADNAAHRWPVDTVDLAYTPDGSRLVLSDANGDLCLLDAETLAPIGEPVHVGAWVWNTQAGAGDHTGFVSVGEDPSELTGSSEFLTPATEWAQVDLESGKVVQRVDFPDGTDAATISPDRTHLALTGQGSVVALIDLGTGRLARSPDRAHRVGTSSVAWSADSSRFAVTAGDGTVSLWDGHTGEPLGSIVNPERNLAGVGFQPDDITLLIAPYTDSFYEWDTSLEHTIEFACTMVGRDATREEWRGWFGDRPYQPTCPQETT